MNLTKESYLSWLKTLPSPRIISIRRIIHIYWGKYVKTKRRWRCQRHLWLPQKASTAQWKVWPFWSSAPHKASFPHNLIWSSSLRVTVREQLLYNDLHYKKFVGRRLLTFQRRHFKLILRILKQISRGNTGSPIFWIQNRYFRFLQLLLCPHLPTGYIPLREQMENIV